MSRVRGLRRGRGEGGRTVRRVRWTAIEWTSRWRTYDLRVHKEGSRFVASYAPPVPAAYVCDVGYPTPEAAMAAAELMARNHFANRQKTKKQARKPRR